MQLYMISDSYIEYLHQKIPEVYSNKIHHRNHMRKYLGPINFNQHYSYFIPLSSPKKSDYQYAGENLVVKKSIIPIVRMYERDANGNKALKGTLRISHMIPAPASAITKYDIEHETDANYKNLIFSELQYIRKNAASIMKKANTMYTQKVTSNSSVSYISFALDFLYLEYLHDQYLSL